MKAEDVLDALCPYCRVKLVVLDKPMRFKPMSPGGNSREQTFTRQCPKCKVLQP